MDCPFRIRRSLVRMTPGVFIWGFPFEMEDAAEGVTFLLPTFSAVKFSNSDLDSPERLDTNEAPCISSPTHMSCAWLSTANIFFRPPASHGLTLLLAPDRNRRRR